MSQSDFERVRADLATIQQATGLEPCLSKESFYASLAFAAGGAILLASWLWLRPEGPWPPWALLAPCIPPVVIQGILVNRAQRTGGSQASLKRRSRDIRATGVLIMAATFAFYWWTKSLGISLLVYYGILFFFLGFAILLGVARDRHGMHFIGPALSFMGLGLLTPYLQFTGLLWGGFYLVFGLSGALGVHLQLRRTY